MLCLLDGCIIVSEQLSNRATFAGVSVVAGGGQDVLESTLCHRHQQISPGSTWESQSSAHCACERLSLLDVADHTVLMAQSDTLPGWLMGVLKGSWKLDRTEEDLDFSEAFKVCM